MESKKEAKRIVVAQSQRMVAITFPNREPFVIWSEDELIELTRQLLAAVERWGKA